MVFQQFRQVETGGVTLEDIDMKIKVKNTKDSGLTFDITTWNLTDDTWSSIKKNKPIRIRLGWENGETSSVVYGVIKKKNKELDGSDVKYVIKGKDKTDEQTKLRLSSTWNNKRPDQIAESVGNKVGLSAGQIDEAPSEIAGYYQVSKDRPIRYWLDQLVKEVQDMDNRAWEWFTDGGRLYFVRKDGRKEQAIKLSYDTTLISIGPSSGKGKTEKGGSGLKFEAMMEPSIRKGAAVVVDTDKHSGPYKVTEYTMKSNSTDGTHTVSGQLTSLGSNYQVVDDYSDATV